MAFIETYITALEEFTLEKNGHPEDTARLSIPRETHTALSNDNFTKLEKQWKVTRKRWRPFRWRICLINSGGGRKTTRH